MKILFVLENYYPNIGGVETLFKNLVDQLVKEGCEAVIVTTRLDPAHPAVEEKKGIKIIRLKLPNRYFFTFFSFFRIFREARHCDLVHTTSYNAALPAFIGGKLAGKKVIVTFHEVWGKLWFDLPFMSRIGRWGHYLFERLLLKLPFDRFVAVSRYTARCLVEAGLPEKKVSRIYNGIDYAEFPERHDPPEEAPFTYTFFGRLGMSKGLDLLIPAAARVREAMPESRLQLIIPRTPGSLFEKIKQRIEELKLDDCSYISSELPFEELKRRLIKSHCAVIPSYSEGFCFAAVECMAMEVPLVHSGKGALSEVVGGLHITYADQSAEALAKGILDASKGRFEERVARKFPLRESISAYLRVYEQIAKNSLPNS